MKLSLFIASQVLIASTYSLDLVNQTPATGFELAQVDEEPNWNHQRAAKMFTYSKEIDLWSNKCHRT